MCHKTEPKLHSLSSLELNKICKQNNHANTENVIFFCHPRCYIFKRFFNTVDSLSKPRSRLCASHCFPLNADLQKKISYLSEHDKNTGTRTRLQYKTGCRKNIQTQKGTRKLYKHCFTYKPFQPCKVYVHISG